MTWRTLLIAALCASPLATSGGRASAEVSTSQCSHIETTGAYDLIDNWRRALMSGSADAVAELYAEDAVLVPSAASTPLRGRDEIRAYFAEFLARHPEPVIAMRSHMRACDGVIEAGTATYRITGVRKGTRMFVTGRYKVELTLRNGRWLIGQQHLALMSLPNRRVLLER